VTGERNRLDGFCEELTPARQRLGKRQAAGADGVNGIPSPKADQPSSKLFAPGVPSNP
jgi:hypothetical protein